MNIQQILSLIIVALATAYLGHNAYRAWIGGRNGKNGCEGRCAGCDFAPKEQARPEVITSLTDLRPPKKERR